MFIPSGGMPSGTGEVHIGPYLNPGHWQGHAPGRGELTTPPSAPFPEPDFTDELGKPAIVTAPDALRLPLDVLQGGAGFSIEGHQPGALALYHKEVLTAEKPLTDAELAEYSSLPLPAGPGGGDAEPDIMPSVLSRLPEAYYTYITDGERTYVSMIHAGVVKAFGRPGHRRNYFVGYPLFGGSKMVGEDGSFKGTAFYAGPPEVELSEAEIGKTSHFFSGLIGGEKIQRINRLEWFINGQEEAGAEEPQIETEQGDTGVPALT